MKNKRFLAGVLFFGLLFAAAWISGSIRTEQPCRNARYAYPEPPAMCNGKKITSADISFRFKATGENKEYNNLFQTAPENEGLRLEWTTLGARPLALVAGTEQGLYGLDLGFTPVLNRWHKARIEMRGTRLTVWLDDVLRTQTDVPGLNPKFTDVAAGTGFSRTRPFQGEIKDFSLKLRRGTHKTDAWQFFALQGLFLFLFFGLARRLFAGETRRKNRPGIWLKPVVFCLGAGLVLGQLWPLSFPPRFEPSAPLVWWELTLLLCAASGAVWKKLGLKNFGAVLAVFGLFYFLKKPFLPVSFPGVASDFALLLMWVFLARTLLGFARSAVSKFFTRAGICAAAATVFFLLSTASLYLRKIHYSGFKLDEMSALFQSNLRESAEFFTSFFSLGDMLLIAFGAAAGGYLFLRAARAKTVPPRTVTFYGAACAGMLVISAALCWWAGPAQSFFMPFSYAIKDYKRIAGEYRHYQQLRQSMAPVHAEKTEKGETYVLIIGEASNRLHWGAYGYFRDTTPWASAQKQRPDVLTFTNAYSSYVHTVPSLAKALTSSNQYNGEYEFAAPSLIEAAKAAGFKTFWLSNQDKISLVDNPLTILAQSADCVRFTNAFRFAGDEALMPYIDETLREMNPQDNNLLIIHLAGSHAEYKQRLPKNYDISFPGGEEYLGNPARRPDFVKNVLDPYDSTLRCATRTKSFPNYTSAFGGSARPSKPCCIFPTTEKTYTGNVFTTRPFFLTKWRASP